MGFLSSLGGIAGGILGDAFGGMVSRKSGRRDQAHTYSQYTSLQAQVRDAKAAGLHPLFAMGASGGAGPGFSIPGQSSSGSLAGQAIQRAGRDLGAHFDSKANLVNAQAALSAVELARHSLSNDTAQGMTIPMHRPAFTEIQKGRSDVHMTKNPEQSLNVKSPMTQVRIGSQKVWVPVEEIDEFMENPLAVGGLTYIYHGNKNVSWSKLASEYAGPGGKTPSWKRALINKAARFIEKARRPGRKKKAFSTKIPTPQRIQ